MRFRASIKNISTFTKITASLSSLGKVAWVRLEDDQLRFTVIPETGTQVWAVLAINSIFETYTIESGAPQNTINLELPVAPLHRALRSAQGASSASLRLTKKDDKPFLILTIVSSTFSHVSAVGLTSTSASAGAVPGLGADANTTNNDDDDDGNLTFDLHAASGGSGVRETTITQEVPVRVLSATSVEGFHEPRCREPDVHIMLPSLTQLKSVSERFTKLALDTTGGGAGGSGSGGPRLELSANMHGCLRLGLVTEGLSIRSLWSGLVNPVLDPSQVEGGVEGVRAHPSTRMMGLGAGDEGGGGEEGWARVRIDGRDWGRVLSVGRLAGRVVACFCHEHALILYVYIPKDEDGGDESVLTYYISTYSA